VDWLEAKGIEFDVVTDEDLDAEGSALLSGYAAVLTGSHPEYSTERMLDGLKEYVDAGGWLLYLGGNGFYWVATTTGKEGSVLEVRRGAAGTRTWTSSPGEEHHSTSGEPGGLWRHRGRPPNLLVAVGFTAQGHDGRSQAYRRLGASFDPYWRWVFAGIKDDYVGAFGLSMGGAAGDEIDRFDPAVGSDPSAVVLARASGFGAYYQLAIEELPHLRQGTDGRDPDVRADMTCWERSGGGCVFAVGSIGWTASLGHAGYDNSVSRVTENVVKEALARQKDGARRRSETTRSEGRLP
jgi:N,N-dimethylformamidase